jgi:hypothetical protein
MEFTHVIYTTYGTVDTTPPIQLKKMDSVDSDWWYHMFYMIYTAAEISHWNQLMTSTLEFLEIK